MQDDKSTVSEDGAVMTKGKGESGDDAVGDYQIRLHVIEARDLKGRDKSGMSDPVVFAKVWGEEHHTPIVKRTTSPLWDHTFFWHKRCTRRDFELSKVHVQVKDANTIFRDVLIGAFDFDVVKVHESPGHELYRKWVGLVDVTDKHEGLQGYLKVSMVCLGPGDEAPHHTAEDEDDDPDTMSSLQAMILLPPTIATQDYQLRLDVHRARHLTKTDTFGTTDAYVRVAFAANPSVSTSVCKASYDPEWNERLSLAITMPTLSDLIRIELMDDDKGSADDVVATTFFSWNRILHTGPTGVGPTWVPLYGAHRGSERSELRKGMNAGTISGKTYKGSLLVSLSAESVPEAKVLKHPISAVPEPTLRAYTVRFDALEVSELASDFDHIRVDLSCGHHRCEGVKADNHSGAVRWYHAIPDWVIDIPAQGGASVPDLFIHVVKDKRLADDQQVGFIRLSWKELLDASQTFQEPRWRAIQPDPFNCSEEVSVAGWMLFRLTVGYAEDFALVERDPVVVPKMESYQLRAHVYQARDLASADETGSADPYCEVRVGHVTARTKHLTETTFPCWFETLCLDLELPEPLSYAPNVNVVVHDWDRVTKDDLVGRCSQPLSSIGPEMPVRPTWMQLHETNPDDPEGAVLVAFQLLPKSIAGSIPIPSIVPTFKDCIAYVGVVGLRRLLPYGLARIKKPRVEVDCGDSAHKASTDGVNKPSGSNPNHLDLLRVPVRIPEHSIFAPPLNIRVYDDRILSNPMVATRSVSLTPFIAWVPNDEREAVLARETVDLPPPVEQVPGTGMAVSADGHVVPASESGARGKQLGKQGPDDGNQAAYRKVRAPAVHHDGDQAGKQDDVMHDDASADVPSDEEVIVLDVLPSGDDHEGGDAHAKALLLGDDVHAKSMPSGGGGGRIAPKSLRGGKKDEALVPVPDPSLRTVPEVEDTPLEPDMEGLTDLSVDVLADRPQVPHELEREFQHAAFSQWELSRGQNRGRTVTGKLRSKGRHVVPAGVFKGHIKVVERSSSDASPDPGLMQLMDSLREPKRLVLRLYMISGDQLVANTKSGSCRPYLKVHVNGRKWSEPKDERLVQPTNKPIFSTVYETDITLPDDAEVLVAIWSEKVGRNEMIGETSIDLENRYFSEEWQAMDAKPLEYRSLWHPASSNPQGRIRMWLDVLTPEEAAANPPVDIRPPGPRDFQLRVIVWNTRNVQFRDKTMSDVFCCVYPDGQKPTRSDIHWRCEDGNALFNWRFLFPLTLPCAAPRLHLQIYDKDLVNPNDVICEANLNLNRFYALGYKKAVNGMSPRTLLPRQWATLTHPNYDGPQGEVEMQVELITAEEARVHPVGPGRDGPEPLEYPPRPETSFNPFRIDKWITKIFWKKFKPYVVGSCIVCLILLILIIFISVAI